MKVIVYTSGVDNGVNIIIPVRESPTSGRAVLEAHKTIVFEDSFLQSEEGMELPYMIDVVNKKWTMFHIRDMASRKGIELTELMTVLESEDDFLDKVSSKSLPADATNVFRIEDHEVMKDRVFRNEWECVGQTLRVNMPKARVKHLDRIRNVRNGKLNELDKDWLKFTGKNMSKEASDVENERETLRNLPQTFDLSVYDTPETLKNAWPEIIERREQIRSV